MWGIREGGTDGRREGVGRERWREGEREGGRKWEGVQRRTDLYVLSESIEDLLGCADGLGETLPPVGINHGLPRVKPVEITY